MSDPLFERTGSDTFRATELGRGPWDPGALHGGPPSALAAGLLEETIAAAGAALDGGAVDFFPARFASELRRPVPVGELTVATRISRPGRKVCVAEATVAAEGVVCLVATLGAIRRRPMTGEIPSVTVDMPDPPSLGRPADIARSELVSFIQDGVEHRLVRGGLELPGPASDWIRLVGPMVDDRPATPLERVVAAADFGNGVSRWFEMDQAVFVNPDLTVGLHRLPVGEWVCLDAVTHLGPDGVGLAESMLFDVHGPIGRSTQSLLVEQR